MQLKSTMFFLCLSLANLAFSSNEMENDFDPQAHCVEVIDKEKLHDNLTTINNYLAAIEDILNDIVSLNSHPRQITKNDQRNLESIFSKLKSSVLTLVKLTGREDLKAHIEKIPLLENEAKVTQWSGKTFRRWMFCACNARNSADFENGNICLTGIFTAGSYPALVYIISGLINLAQATAIAATCCAESETFNVKHELNYGKNEWEAAIKNIRVAIVRIAHKNGLIVGEEQYWEENLKLANCKSL